MSSRPDRFAWSDDDAPRAVGICHLCRHFQADRCAAFPEGIPYKVLLGDVDHRLPIEGDRGIQFEPREEKP